MSGAEKTRFQPGIKGGGASGSKTAGSKTIGGPDSVVPGGKAFGTGGAGPSGKPNPVQVTYQGKIVTPQSLQYRPKAKGAADASAPKSSYNGLLKKSSPDAEAELNKQKLSQHGKQ